VLDAGSAESRQAVRLGSEPQQSALLNVSAGCLGAFNGGDRTTLGATFTVSPKQAITSP
jgi:hypothetical protein